MFILLLENTVNGKLKVTDVFFKEIIYMREVIKGEKAGNSAIICARVEIFCKATRRLFGGYLQQPVGPEQREQRRRLVCFALAPMKRSSGGEKRNSRPPTGQQKTAVTPIR